MFVACVDTHKKFPFEFYKRPAGIFIVVQIVTPVVKSWPRAKN